MATVYFDSTLKCWNGRIKPYYDCTFHVDDLYDKKLVWFHEGYGLMKLYRVHRVEEAEVDEDRANYIAEVVGPVCHTSSDDWTRAVQDPDEYLKEYLERKGA